MALFRLTSGRSARSASAILLAAATVVVACLSGSAPAWAACQTTTQVVAPGATFTNTGCISTNNADAVDAGPNSTVNNSATGQINLTSNSVFLFSGINATGNGNTLVNNGSMGLTVQGIATADLISALGSGNSITNNGTMTVTVGSASQGGGAIVIGSGTATNNGTITINGANTNFISNGMLGFATAQLINNGTISGTVPADAMLCGGANCTATNSAGASITLSGPASAGMTTANSLNGVSLTNNGTITLTGNNSVGMQSAFGGFSNTLLNTGAINVSGGSGSIGMAMGDCNGSACFNPPGTVSTATNKGSINVTGPGNYGFAFVTQFLPDALIMIVGQPLGPSGNTFVNNGSVVAGPNAIAVGDIAQVHGLENAHPSFNSVINNGVIDGQIALSQGTNESLTNNGLITISYPGSGVTHSINGTFTQTSSGTLALRVDANGGNDKLAVNGVANLGGTLQALVQPGSYKPSTTYTIVTASNGVNGTFANVTDNSPLLTPSVTYDANDAFLHLTFAGIPLTGLTPNEAATARGLNSLFTTANNNNANILFNAFGALNLGQISNALDLLSGEIHASVQSVLIEDSAFFRNAMLEQMRQWTFSQFPSNFRSRYRVEHYADPSADEADAALAYAGATKPSFPIKAPPAATGYDPAWTLWAQGVGAWGRIDGDGNAAGVTRRFSGFFTGVDRRFGDWLAGFAAGYSNSSLNVSARASSANLDTGYAGAYAGTSFGPWNLRTGGALSLTTVATNRSIAFPGFADAASARYDASTGQVFGELGYGMRYGNTAIEPFGGLAFVSVHADGFTETGGPAALGGSAATEDVGYSSLGARATTVYALPNGMVVIPNALIAWQHAFGNVVPATSLAFLAGGSPFTIAGVPIARDAALVQAGFNVSVSPRVTLGVAYQGELAGNAQDHSVKGTFTWRF